MTDIENAEFAGIRTKLPNIAAFARDAEKKVTIGVMNRVLRLADRKTDVQRPNKLPYYSIIPLKEILAEIGRVGINSKKISEIYYSHLRKIGSELDILLHVPIEEIRKKGNENLAEAVYRMRNKEIFIEEGFDGKFGEIKVFPEKS